ncbi:MAG TPA: SpoVR family protein [Chloroflexia bacterium]|nr:SpoVR family protein [Chloroflexia bacterium]
MDTRAIAALEAAMGQIWEIARKFNLDPFPTHFELVPAAIMYEFGAYGLPGRFAHWSFGKGYYRMKTQYDYGLSKIYEMVINANPAFAFLMESNSVLQNKLVIAHVLGHTDFFKHNAYFTQTNRAMVESVSLNAERIRKYEFEHGTRAVEQFLDAAISIQEHIDPHIRFRRAAPEQSGRPQPPRTAASSGYEDLWELGADAATDRAEHRAAAERIASSPARIPPEPEKDVVRFLIEHAPDLAEWQRDILAIIRQEMLYFVPQMQTKIMNEGWACATGDALLLTENGFLRFEHVHESGAPIRVAAGGGGELQPITGHHREPQVPTIRLRTRRGLTIEGAHQHRLRLADGTWAALADLKVGDHVALDSGANIWPAAEHAIDAEVAWLLGYCAGGSRSTESGICLTGGDEELGEKLGLAIQTTFGVPAPRSGDAPEHGGRWQIAIPSCALQRVLDSRGIDFDASAPARQIPQAILRAPKPTMSAFLRGYFDAGGYTRQAESIRLSSSSAALIPTVQIILLNYGILSWQCPQPDGGSQLALTGSSAARYLDEIGVTRAGPQDALRAHGEEGLGGQEEDPSDIVVAIAAGCADVFDITVATRHSYVANGFVNHNSFWHARILRELDLTDQEVMEFANLNAGVVSPHRRSINPYHLGLKMFEDIERRWDAPTEAERARGRQPGQGRAQIFEVRELESDISFLRNYLTRELIAELDLYLYERQGNDWVIVEKDWEKVRDGLVNEMTNFGNPTILVEDADYHRARELYLIHQHEGRDLDTVYAEKTLQYLYQIWGRPTHLETVLDGDRVLLSYDGAKNSRTDL